jgi:hypothetical protein
MFPAIRGQFALTTIADEVIGRVPVLDNVESFVDLPLNLWRSKVIAKKRRLFSLADFGQRSEGREDYILGGLPGVAERRSRRLSLDQDAEG